MRVMFVRVDSLRISFAAIIALRHRTGGCSDPKHSGHPASSVDVVDNRLSARLVVVQMAVCEVDARALVRHCGKAHFDSASLGPISSKLLDC